MAYTDSHIDTRKGIMDSLINRVARVMYSADSFVDLLPWEKALPEERDHYTRVAEVVIDEVVGFMKERDEQMGGGLSAAIEYVSLSVEKMRLTRIEGQR